MSMTHFSLLALMIFRTFYILFSILNQQMILTCLINKPNRRVDLSRVRPCHLTTGTSSQPTGMKRSEWVTAGLRTTSRPSVWDTSSEYLRLTWTLPAPHLPSSLVNNVSLNVSGSSVLCWSCLVIHAGCCLDLGYVGVTDPWQQLNTGVALKGTVRPKMQRWCGTSIKHVCHQYVSRSAFTSPSRDLGLLRGV